MKLLYISIIAGILLSSIVLAGLTSIYKPDLSTDEVKALADCGISKYRLMNQTTIGNVNRMNVIFYNSSNFPVKVLPIKWYTGEKTDFLIKNETGNLIRNVIIPACQKSKAGTGTNNKDNIPDDIIDLGEK